MEGNDRVTWLRLTRRNFFSLTIGLTLRQELHSQTKQLMVDINNECASAHVTQSSTTTMLT